ncbi:MAG: EamA family transporter [Clostridia bacterium]|nr:EamA family transporter [Clostridia bacterium]
MSPSASSRLRIITAMVIFGTIGIFRRYIPLDSSLIALVRGVVGTAFLLLVMLLTRTKADRAAICRNLKLLVISGAAIGINWILLFESYRYTSVATATLCYYMAPIFVMLLSPVVLGQRLTKLKMICVGVALAGMVLVSGVLENGGGGFRGILLGLGAAAFYASVILMNQFIRDIPAYDKTILQLGSASAVLLPYVLLTVNFAAQALTPMAVLMLLVVGVVHTGAAYWLYFGGMKNLPAQTIALLSYLDPVVAIVLSALLLGEPMTLLTGVGAVLVLGATAVSEMKQ